MLRRIGKRLSLLRSQVGDRILIEQGRGMQRGNGTVPIDDSNWRVCYDQRKGRLTCAQGSVPSVQVTLGNARSAFERNKGKWPWAGSVSIGPKESAACLVRRSGARGSLLDNSELDFGRKKECGSGNRSLGGCGLRQPHRVIPARDWCRPRPTLSGKSRRLSLFSQRSPS